MDINEYIEVGKKHYVEEDFEKAIECFKKAVELDPQNFKAHFHLGAAYYKAGKFEEALKCYESFIIHEEKGY